MDLETLLQLRQVTFLSSDHSSSTMLFRFIEEGIQKEIDNASGCEWDTAGSSKIRKEQCDMLIKKYKL